MVITCKYNEISTAETKQYKYTNPVDLTDIPTLVIFVSTPAK